MIRALLFRAHILTEISRERMTS